MESKSKELQVQQEASLMGAAALKTNPLLKDFAKFKDQQISDSIEAAHKALVLDVPVQKIPESVFINEILPFLCGDTSSQLTPEKWVSIAGSPFSEIDIHDDAGNILFRLPSMLERNVISHREASQRGSLANAMITLDQMRNFSPIRAENYLRGEFHQRGISKNAMKIAVETAKRWEAIFARYGKVIDPQTGRAVDAQTNTSKRLSVNNKQTVAQSTFTHEHDDLL